MQCVPPGAHSTLDLEPCLAQLGGENGNCHPLPPSHKSTLRINVTEAARITDLVCKELKKIKGYARRYEIEGASAGLIASVLGAFGSIGDDKILAYSMQVSAFHLNGGQVRLCFFFWSHRVCSFSCSFLYHNG